MDFHPFSFPPIIRNARQTQAFIEAVQPESKLEPSSRSSSFHAVELRADLSMKVLEWRTVNGEQHIHACLFMSERLSQDFEYFVALSLDGISPLKILSRTFSEKRCSGFLTERSNSSYFSSSPPVTNSAAILIPFRREYLLFVDASTGLRYLSFENANIVENQPLSSHILQWKMSLQFQTFLQVYSLQAEILGKSRSRYQFKSLHSVPRVSPLLFLSHFS